MITRLPKSAFARAALLLLLSSGLVQANLLTGTVNGPEGLVSGARVVIGADGIDEIETFSDGSGAFSVEVPSEYLLYIFPEPPAEGSGLIGERVEQVSISGGRALRLTLAQEVTITGHINVPEGFAGELPVHLARLDKWDRAGDWGVDGEYNFSATQAAGVYVIQVRGECKFSDPPGYEVCDTADRFSYLPVDASQGSVNGLVIPFPTKLEPIPDNTPPIASLISIGAADEGGIAVVTGAPGTVSGPAAIRVFNLNTGQFTNGASLANGAFSIPIFAPAGAWLSVSQDPTGLNSGNPQAATTIIQAPPPGLPGTGFATMMPVKRDGPTFHSNNPSSTGIEDGGHAWFGLELPDRNWERGETINLSGAYRLYARNAATININELNTWGHLYLERVFSADGKQEIGNPEFMSHVLTPTGLPIEKRGKYTAIYDRLDLGFLGIDPGTLTSDYSFEGAWDKSVEIPGNLPDGIYRLILESQLGNLPIEGRHFEGAYSNSGLTDRLFHYGGLGLITIGNPSSPRLSWALGLNEFSNGKRGTVAIEDSDRLQIAGRVTSNPGKFVLPKENPQTGAPRSYNLEPFVPLTGADNKGWFAPQTIPFAFPSGSLQVSIQKPDGSVENLGSAPFRQPYMQEVSGPSGNSVSPVSNSSSLYFGLTTLDDRFNVTFDQYGQHRIAMQGSIDDIFGTAYPGGGSYDIYIARHLDIETGVFPHTPFEVGDSFAPAVIVQPGVEAEIDIEINHYPESDPAQLIVTKIKGRTNRFGYFQSGPGNAYVFGVPGEYSVEITASHTDSEGVLWMGNEYWASVVETPGRPVIAHGRRNFSYESGEHSQWVIADANNIAGGHLPFPYHTGDIMWMIDTEHDDFFTAAFPSITVQDNTGGSFADLVRVRNDAHDSPYEIENQIAIGQIPLFSSRADGISAFLLPNAPDSHMAYHYGGAARPGVRVRDMVSEDDTQNSYWRFEDPYHYQAGSGMNGDLPNDFKFMFGGAVYRAPDLDLFYYGAYGSMWVLLPNDDPVGTRVFPPFQGNGGGPSGGPIMTLKGEEIDIFFHPTGTRPGSILETGNRVSFSGQIGPTLPSQIEITITSPSAQVTSINGTANKVGYFYQPGTDFAVFEVGKWTVNVNVFHDGLTSAGATVEPFPSGNVLGANAGEFSFYVVEKGSFPLDAAGPGPVWVEPGNGIVPITITPPPGLTDVQLHYTTVMPGFILEQGITTNMTYNYDAPTLNADFPNLDLFDADYRTGVDTITMSFLLSGMDGEGNTVYRARQVLLQGEELMFPAQTRSNILLLNGFE
jgi:hypothetical protein